MCTQHFNNPDKKYTFHILTTTTTKKYSSLLFTHLLIQFEKHTVDSGCPLHFVPNMITSHSPTTTPTKRRERKKTNRSENECAFIREKNKFYKIIY